MKSAVDERETLLHSHALYDLNGFIFSYTVVVSTRLKKATGRHWTGIFIFVWPDALSKRLWVVQSLYLDNTATTFICVWYQRIQIKKEAAKKTKIWLEMQHHQKWANYTETEEVVSKNGMNSILRQNFLECTSLTNKSDVGSGRNSACHRHAHEIGDFMILVCTKHSMIGIKSMNAHLQKNPYINENGSSFL